MKNQNKQNESHKIIKKAYLIFSATFIILCLAAIYVYQGQSDLIKATDTANKYTNFPVRMEELISSLKDSETGVRGFLFSHDSMYLQPYLNADKKANSILHILKGYVKLGVINEKQFYELIKLTTEILSIQNTYLLKNKANEKVDLKYGKNRMDSLRAIINDIKISSMQKVVEYRQDQNDSIHKQPYYLLLIIFAALSIFLMSAFFILKFIKDLINTQVDLALKIEEANQYNKELDQYSFTLTHHLQEPLRKMRLFLSRFEVKNKRLFTEGEGAESLRKVDESAKQAQTYLNEFLNYSKLMRHETLKFEAVNINRVIEEILKEKNETLKALDAQIFIDNMPVIIGEAHYIKLLWWHLIDNALKFRYPQRPPIIHINYHKRNKKYIHFSISDNGCGIKSEYLNKIFDIFQRISNENAMKGIGMGLAICKRIIVEHKGSISVESIENESSIFHIYLPITE